MKTKLNRLLALVLLGALFMTMLGAAAYVPNDPGAAGSPEENNAQRSVSDPNAEEATKHLQEKATYSNPLYATVSSGQIMTAALKSANGITPLADSEGTFKEENGDVYYYLPLGFTITDSYGNQWSYSVKYKLDSTTQTATLTSIQGATSVFTGDEDLSVIGTLTTITYQDTEYTVTTVGEKAFQYSKLKKIQIPETITRIEEYAFDHCEAAETINIPAGVTYIGRAAFNMCKNLKQITIPAGITEISASAFSACWSIDPNQLIIPENITSIGNSAFYQIGRDSGSLADLIIPNNVTSIGEWAFIGANLSSITFPAGRTDDLILADGNNCFATCPNLKTVTILSDKVKIMNGEFRGCADDAVAYYISNDQQPSRVPTQVRYLVNEDGKTVTINWVRNNGIAQTPEKIGDWYVSAVTAFYAEQGKHVCYFGENDSLYYCTICSTPNPNHTHDWDTEYTTDWEATCTKNGQKSQHCRTCDQVRNITVIPASHTLTHYEKTEPDCTETGTKEHWNCSVCGKNFSDENGNNRLTDITIPANGHTMTHYEKIAATCTDAGQAEYWRCSVCEINFSDEDGVEELSDMVLPANGHTMTYHETVAPTCTETGTLAYWSCSACGKNFSDQDGQNELNDLTIAATGHTMIRQEQTEPTCTETGITAHWHCSACGKNFADENGQEELTDVTVPANGHTMTHYEKILATCTDAGQAEYWHCAVCERNFSDEAGMKELTDTVLPPTGHTMVHHEKVEPTCTEDGRAEYWQCSVCGKQFSDRNGTAEITDLTLPMTGHTYGTAWNADESKHWRICACGDRSEEAAHTFQWVTGRNATAAQPGSMYEACTVCGYQKSAAQELPKHPQDTEHIQFKMILTQGIRDIPQSLREKGLDSSEKIETALKVEITKTATSYSNTAVYNVTLLVRRQGSNQWEKADVSNFPSNGRLQVILPYPEGTGRDTHDFLVAHMFTTYDFGKTPGQMEIPTVTKTEEGLQFDVTGLSPILLSWKDISAPLPDESSPSDERNDPPNETKPSGENNSSNGTGTSNENNSSNGTDTSGGDNPPNENHTSGGDNPSNENHTSGGNNQSGSNNTSDSNHSSNNSNPPIGNIRSADDVQAAGSELANQPVPMQSIATGDDPHPEIWILLLIVSCGGIGVILKKRTVH